MDFSLKMIFQVNVHLGIDRIYGEVMLIDVKWLQDNYAKYSQEFFSGKMPPVTFKISKTMGRRGDATCTINYIDGRVEFCGYIIRVSNAYDVDEKHKLNTLLHEMIHIYDYYNHPEHYIIKTAAGWKKNRKYDAHGNELFLPMAAMINQHGFNITKYVTKEERDESEYSDDITRKLEKPICLCYAEYMKEGQPNLMFLASRLTLNKIISRYKGVSKRFAPASITVYEISSPELRKNYSIIKGDMIRGYRYPMEKWFALLEHLGIEEKTPEMIYFNDMDYMYEQKIIKLTEADIRAIVSETLDELMNADSVEPVDGGNAVGVKTSPTSVRLSIV